MAACWKRQPHDRLSIKELHYKLDRICMSQPTYLDLIAWNWRQPILSFSHFSRMWQRCITSGVFDQLFIASDYYRLTIWWKNSSPITWWERVINMIWSIFHRRQIKKCMVSLMCIRRNLESPVKGCSENGSYNCVNTWDFYTSCILLNTLCFLLLLYFIFLERLSLQYTCYCFVVLRLI